MCNLKLCLKLSHIQTVATLMSAISFDFQSFLGAFVFGIISDNFVLISNQTNQIINSSLLGYRDGAREESDWEN